jgi:hypothetical protein
MKKRKGNEKQEENKKPEKNERKTTQKNNPATAALTGRPNIAPTRV